MSRTYEYRSGLASQISAFIAEKRACGCKCEKEAKTFQTLDRFLVEQGINTPVLPELVVEKWIEKRPNEKRKNQKWRLNFTKRFAKYLQLNGYAAYYPELTISSRDDADFSPCIFTSDELARIMKYFETMVPSRQCPTAHLVFPLLFKTLICCGLRAGEATLLRVKDVDLTEMHMLAPEKSHLPLFMNRNGQKLTRAGVTYILNKYAKAASVIDPSIPEKIPPHLMRHTKAMHIYDADNDLVHVRDFLGHSDIKTTDIYARSSLTMKQKALERVSDSPVPSMPSWQKSRSTMEWLKSFGSQKA